jgi:hypothetical protein
MSMRAATIPARREVFSATPAALPSTTLWIASDSRLLSPSRPWVAKCTLVAPPTVVSTTPGMVPTPATFWLASTSYGVVPEAA